MTSTPEQPLVDQLAASLRDDREARHRAWTDVTHARTGADEVAQARSEAGDSPEDVAVARALYTPMSDDARERLLAMMSATASSPSAPREAPANDHRYRSWSLALVGLLTAAAALLLIWRLTLGDRSNDDTRVARAALPAYELEPGPSLAQQRGDPPSPAPTEQRYRPNNTFEWLLRPTTEHAHVVSVRVCARAADGVGHELDVRGLVQTSGSGAIHLRGKVGALHLAAGAWQLGFAIGHADMLAEPRSICVWFDGDAPDEVQVVSLGLVIEP